MLILLFLIPKNCKLQLGHFNLDDSPRIERSSRGEPLEQSHRVKEREAAATWQMLDLCFWNSDLSWCWNPILNLLIDA